MANVISVMQRYELKYLLTPQQLEFLKEAIKGRMELDCYGRCPILSLYYDTPDYRLIRNSLEKPPFKEKIRLRSYGLARGSSPVYLELKRKAKGLVYKRRVATKKEDAESFFQRKSDLCAEGQIAKEISYFRDFYQNLVPACLIIVDREAYYEVGGEVRLTIDTNPRYRVDHLDLSTSLGGTPLLEEGGAIVEIKIPGAMPLWLSHILSEGGIYKTSFSKYGHAYVEQVEKLRRAERA